MKIHLCPSHELKCLVSALSSHYVQPVLKFLQKGPKDVCRDVVNRENTGGKNTGGGKWKF